MDDTQLILLIALGGLAVLAALLIALRGERSRTELAARLAQLAESHSHSQANLAQGLVDHERAVGERIADVHRRVGASLDKTSDKTQTTMGDLRERIARLDAAQKNITELSTQMVSLQDILSNKQARGAFGEIQLNDLVSQVLPPSAYEFQAQIGDGKRVDCLLRLPYPPGPVAVDAKFPLESYRAMQDAKDDAAKLRAARSFRADMLKHVADIKEKYIVPGETAEAAFMFLPSEAIYSELHASFGEVVEQSFRDRVFIVSPTTLWATLNTVRAVFRDVRMREQAGEIQKLVRVMMKDVARLDERADKLHRHFEMAQKDVSEIRTSTGKIVKRGEAIDSIEVSDAEADSVEAGEAESLEAGEAGSLQAGEAGEAAEVAKIAVFTPPDRRLADKS